MKPLLLLFQFTYKADSNQLRFLQLLSSEAWQQLTYHCKNSVAVFDATRRNLRNAMQIMTAADMELKARGNRKFRYRVVEDGCKVRRELMCGKVYHTQCHLGSSRL